MRIIVQFSTLILIIGLISNCSTQKEQTRVLTATDSLWLNFATAMEGRNLDYLIANSLDSIFCVDCEYSNSGSDRKLYQAEYLFNNLMPELMHLDDLTMTEFSTYQDSTGIMVNYSIASKNAPEGGYNLIFVLEYTHGNYYLAERTFVP